MDAPLRLEPPFSPLKITPTEANTLYKKNLHRISAFVTYHLGMRLANFFDQNMFLKANAPTFCGHPDRTRNVFHKDPNIFLNTLQEKLNQHVWTFLQPITGHLLSFGLQVIYIQAYLAIDQIAKAIIEDNNRHLQAFKTNPLQIQHILLKKIHKVLEDTLLAYKEANSVHLPSVSEPSVEEMQILTEAFIATKDPSFTLNTGIDEAIQEHGYNMNEAITSSLGWNIAKEIVHKDTGKELPSAPSTWAHFIALMNALNINPETRQLTIETVKRALIQWQIEERASSFPLPEKTFEESREAYKGLIWETQLTLITTRLVALKKFKSSLEFDQELKKFIAHHLKYDQLLYQSLIEEEAHIQALQNKGYRNLTALKSHIFSIVFGYPHITPWVKTIIQSMWPDFNADQINEYVEVIAPELRIISENGRLSVKISRRYSALLLEPDIDPEWKKRVEEIVAKCESDIEAKMQTVDSVLAAFLGVIEEDKQKNISSLQLKSPSQILTNFYYELLSAVIKKYFIPINFQLVKAPEDKAKAIFSTWTRAIAPDDHPLKALCYKITGAVLASLGYLYAATVSRLYNYLMPKFILFFVQRYLADIATLIFDNLKKTLMEKELAKTYLFETLNRLLNEAQEEDPTPYTSNKETVATIEKILKTLYNFINSSSINSADFLFHRKIVEAIEKTLQQTLQDPRLIDKILTNLSESMQCLFNEWNAPAIDAANLRKKARQEEEQFYNHTLKVPLKPQKPDKTFLPNPFAYFWSNAKYMAHGLASYPAYKLLRTPVRTILDPLHHHSTVTALIHSTVNIVTNHLTTDPEHD